MSLLLFILIVPALFTIPIAFCWKQFEKAGQKGWYSLIPYYNIYVFLKIIGKEKKFWWWFFIVFPYINIFMLLLMLVELGSAGAHASPLRQRRGREAPQCHRQCHRQVVRQLEQVIKRIKNKKRPQKMRPLFVSEKLINKKSVRGQWIVQTILPLHS